MKIAIAGFGCGLGRTGGVQVYVRGLLNALDLHAAHAGAGHDFTLLLGPDDQAPPLSERFHIVHGAAAPVGGPTWRRLARLLPGRTSSLDRLGFDVVHYPATRLHEPAPRAPAVLTFFDMQEEFLPEAFPWRERWARRLLHRRGVRRAALVLAPSRFTYDCLRARYRVPAAKLRHVAPGVEAAFFAPFAAADEARLRERHGLTPGGFLLYPANPWPHKNHERLFRALARLAARGGPAPLVVCTGRVQGEPRRVSDLAHRAGLRPERLCDLGFVAPDDLPRLMRAARLLVFPSLFEGFGLPVAEALAAGCPVVCSAIPPLLEITGGAARTFDPYDEEALAEAVGALWDDAGARERLAAQGRARAEEYRWERSVPALLAAYEAAAASRAGTRSADGVLPPG